MKNLRKGIALALLTTSIFSTSICFEANTVYAASNIQKAADKDIYNPNAFTERIQKILAEYDNRSTKKQTNDGKAAEITSKSTQIENNEHITAPAAPKTQPPVPTLESQHNFKNEGRYNFDWQGTPIAQSLYAVAKVANRDIVVNGTLSGNVYMSLHNVTCENAMQYLSNAFNFNWMVDDNIIMVSTSDLMLQSKVLNIHYLSDL